jgi:hypothetical protein
MNRIIPIACALMLLPIAAAAQTARNANPEPPKTLLENSQIKVRELRMRPGEKSGAQNYPNSFVYGLTDGELVFAPSGRTPYELSFKAGEALWLPAQASAVSNESGKEVRALVVEIKEKAPAIKTKGKGKQKGQGGRKTAQAKSKAEKQ